MSSTTIAPGGARDSVSEAARELRAFAASFAEDGESFSLGASSGELSALRGIADTLFNTGFGPRGGEGLSKTERREIAESGLELMREYGGAILGEGQVDDLLAIADRLDAATGIDTTAPDGTEAPADNVNEELALDLLDMALRTDDPEDKATLIKAAIEALGGNAEKPAAADGEAGGAPEAGGPAEADGAPEAGGMPPEMAEPRAYTGDDLRALLRSEGGTVREDRGGFGVGDGAQGVDRAGSEIDRGQALFFDLPGEQMAEGATVRLGSLFDRGPDGSFTERATVIARNAEGEVVGEYEVRGTADGNAEVEIDKPFASLEFRPADNGAGGSSNNSDFNLQSVEIGAPSDTGAPALSEADLTKMLDLLTRLTTLIESAVSDAAVRAQLLDSVARVLNDIVPSAQG